MVFRGVHSYVGVYVTVCCYRYVFEGHILAVGGPLIPWAHPSCLPTLSPSGQTVWPQLSQDRAGSSADVHVLST